MIYVRGNDNESWQCSAGGQQSHYYCIDCSYIPVVHTCMKVPVHVDTRSKSVLETCVFDLIVQHHYFTPALQ